MIGLENERPIPIDATHSDICKFSGVADPLFTPVLAQIKRCVSLAKSNSTKPAKDQSKGNAQHPCQTPCWIPSRDSPSELIDNQAAASALHCPLCPKSTVLWKKFRANITWWTSYGIRRYREVDVSYCCNLRSWGYRVRPSLCQISPILIRTLE